MAIRARGHQEWRSMRTSERGRLIPEPERRRITVDIFGPVAGLHEMMRHGSLFRGLSADEDDVEARCVLAMALFIGSPFMAADHGTRSRADVVGLALARLLS
jgi:hypothetical protein